MSLRFMTRLAVVGILGLVSATAVAQDAPHARRYRFLPRFSVLNEHGGFAGQSVDYRVRGTFGFAVEHQDVPWEQTAKFVRVEAWASHPILAYVLDLDDTLNLSGLEGKQLPVAAPFDVFRFRGHTSDGSSVELLTSLIGPWMLLHGETTAPPIGADFFEYTLHALARTRPFADFDDDGAVDRHDLAAWLSRFNAHTADFVDPTVGDADGDGDIDGADFLTWQQQVGEVAPAMDALDAMVNAAIAGSSGGAAAVPEPAAAALLLIAAAAALAVRGRR